MKQRQRKGLDPSSSNDIEPSVELLNVDLEVLGDFDRELVLRAFGDAVVVIAEEPLLSLELVDGSAATLMTKLAAFVALVRAMPKDARQAWNAATRRVLNMGIQSGLKPYSTSWNIPSDVLASLVEIRAEMTLTIYGAEYDAPDR